MQRSLSDLTSVVACVTVIDLSTFWNNLYSVEDVSDRDADGRRITDEGEELSIAELLVEQVEFSNLILLNKMDLVDESATKSVEELVKRLRPDTSILRTTHSESSLTDILKTTPISFDR